MYLDKILKKVNSSIRKKTALKQLDLKRISILLIELQQIRNFSTDIRNCPNIQIENAIKNLASLLGIISTDQNKNKEIPLSNKLN